MSSDSELRALERAAAAGDAEAAANADALRDRAANVLEALRGPRWRRIFRWVAGPWGSARERKGRHLYVVGCPGHKYSDGRPGAVDHRGMFVHQESLIPRVLAREKVAKLEHLSDDERGVEVHAEMQGGGFLYVRLDPDLRDGRLGAGTVHVGPCLRSTERLTRAGSERERREREEAMRRLRDDRDDRDWPTFFGGGLERG